MSPSFQPRLGVTAALCLFSYSFTAYAQDAGDETALSPVVVSATRIPTPQEQVGSSVTVITSDEIEASQQRTLPDVLQDVPGLNMVQSGGPGSIAQVYIRGANPIETKVLIDGIDMSDPSSADGSFDFSQILTSDIDRVEVLRGPQSGLYGSDAIGGVVNIITKQGTGPGQFTGSVEGGSFDTFNQNAGIGGSTGRFNYMLNASHFYSGDTQVTPTNLLPPGVGETHDAYDNDTLSTKLGANLTDNLDVGLVARYINSGLVFTEDDGSGPESDHTHNNDKELFTRETAHLVSFDGALDQTVGLGYSNYQRDAVDPNLTAYDNFSSYGGDRVKADWQGNIKLAQGQTLTLGAERQIDRLDDPGQVSADMANNAAYTQLQSAFGKQLFNTISLRDDDNSLFGNHPTYRIAPAYLIPDTDTKLKASVGSGFKAPTLDELFHNYPGLDFYANPNLKPETSVGYDFGFEQSMLKKQVQFGSTYFHNNIKDLLTAQYDPIGMTSTEVNVGRVTTQGFENFVAYKPWKSLTLRADYTFTLAKDDIAHEELQRRPKNKATLSSTWQATGKLSFTGSVLYTGPWADSMRTYPYANVTAGGYTLVNLAANYSLGDGLTAFGRIDNALDKRYEDPIGFDHPGFGIYAGLKYALEATKGE